jgi:integrase/recombinase XerD
MKVYLEASEIAQMEKAADNLRDRLLIRLLFHSGCRVSEALGLATDDIDFSHDFVTIKHLKTRLRLSCSTCGQRLSRNHTFCPKCGGKIRKTQAEEQQYQRQRVLPVDSETLGLLKEYIDQGGPVLQDGKRLIFGINRHRAWQIVKECAARAGLPNLVNPETGKMHNVSPHKLRDAFAVMAIKRNDSGDGLRLLQEHLGHQSFNTTAKYRKISGKEHREWVNKLWNEDKP